MRIDYNWYWIKWDEENVEWVFEWKSKEKRKECEDLPIMRKTVCPAERASRGDN